MITALKGNHAKVTINGATKLRVHATVDGWVGYYPGQDASLRQSFVSPAEAATWFILQCAMNLGIVLLGDELAMVVDAIVAY